MGRYYGYAYKNRKTLKVVEEEAEKVRSLYRYYLEGDTMDIAAQKAGLFLCRESVSRILHRDYYIGKDRFPAIMEPELFYPVQEKLKETEDVFFYIRNCKNRPAPEILRFRIEPGDYEGDDIYQRAEHAYSQIREEL
ncbi:MAG: hypothetical protein Q4B72_13355 [Lachnospiraceae bacterium]|nr:hypothetical protein [Lachnospiraceae bacterium]